jgi:hypothetical protein
MWPLQRGRKGCVCLRLASALGWIGWIHIREHVVNNMVLNNAVEDVTTNEAKLTIDG